MIDYKKLIVFQKFHMNAMLIYDLTDLFPKHEKSGVISQIRSAAVSIPTNISEGCGKFTSRDFTNFLRTSLGSAQEAEYLSFFSLSRKYLKKEDYDKIYLLINEIKAMLISLIKKLRTNK